MGPECMTALVTGADNGIGAEIAIGLACAGAAVLLHAGSTPQVSEIAMIIALRAPQTEVRIVTEDVARGFLNSHAINRLLVAAPINVLINNAATVERPIDSPPLSSAHLLRRAVESRVIAAADLSAKLTPRMTKAGWGRIVNVSSSALSRTNAVFGADPYTAAAVALEVHSRHLAAELDGTGVTVNVYRPGSVGGDRQGRTPKRNEQRIGGGGSGPFHRHSNLSGRPITPHKSAMALLSHLFAPEGDQTGAIWEVKDIILPN